MKTLIDLFKTFEDGGREVFVYRTGVRRFTFNYSEVYKLSLQMADYLGNKGIKKGDKVALWAPNNPFWAISYFGIILSEAVVVPIDFASGVKRAETIVALSGAKFVIQSNYKFEKLSSKEGVMIEDLPFLLKPQNKKMKLPKTNSSEIVEIVYTSGTTGDPKGVVLTHKNIISNILEACSHISFPSENRRINFLSVLPLSHMLEQTVGFLTPLYRGDKIIYLRTIKPTAIMQAFKDENIAAMIVVPRFLSLLKNVIERELLSKGLRKVINFKIARKIILKAVRKKFGKNFVMFMTGGAALPIDVFRFWKEMGFKVIEGYGLTECSPIVTANTFDEQIEGSVGKPLGGVQIKLENREILVKGESVFKSYYQNSKATDAAFKDGWFRTGDFGDISKDGFTFIKGRKKDVIVNASGINIYPDEIEAVLNKIEGVKEACVIGINKEEGEEVHAVLLLKNKDINAHKIINSANEKLDSLQQISGFSLWTEFDFPRTTTLKIQKFKVKEKILSNSKKEIASSGDTLLSLLANVSKKEEPEIKESSLLTSDLGLSSLSRLELINYIEQEFRVDLEDTVINQTTTVSDLRLLLEKREKGRKQKGLWSWINNPLGKGIRETLDIIFHRPLSRLFFDLESHGLSNLKNIKWPVVFISNHVSYLDQPVIMYSLPRKIRYNTATATREEFFFTEKRTSLIKNSLFLYTMIAFNAFLLPQKRGFRKSLSFIGKLIDRKVNILVFPEGTRAKNGKLGPFMQGLGLLAKELQVPIVPIKILGMEKIYPRGTKFPKKGKCKVIFGKPIEFTTQSPDEIVEVSRKAILELTPN